MTTASYKTGVIEVAPNAYAFIQDNCATNAAFIVSDEGVLVIDSLMTPSLAGKLYAAIRNVTNAPIRYLINTHFHGDHVFGNQYFLPAPIVAHENCRTELQEKFDANMQRYRQREALIPELEQIRMTLPDVTFEDKMTIRLGDRVIEMSFLGRAHSNSDILTYLPDDKVLFVGDIAVHKTLPAFPDGHITKWLTVIDETAKVDADVVVPGHGPVGGKVEFEEARELLQILNSEIRKGYDAGLPEEETAKKVNVGKFSNFANQERVGQITQMAYLAYKGELQ